jgi:hypothetical protein
MMQQIIDVWNVESYTVEIERSVICVIAFTLPTAHATISSWLVT